MIIGGHRGDYYAKGKIFSTLTTGNIMANKLIDEQTVPLIGLTDSAAYGHLMSIAEVATYLNMKQSTLYAYVERKQIPHIRIGKLIRFSQQQINVWLDDLAVSVNETRQTREGYLGFRKSPKEIDEIVSKAIAGSIKVDYTNKRGKQPAASGKEE